MLKLLSACDSDNYKPRHLIIAENDSMSIQKSKGLVNDEHSKIHLVKRSRTVGQNYFLSIFTTLLAIFHSVPLVYKIKPELLLVNGPGTCLPICLITFIFSVIKCKFFLHRKNFNQYQSRFESILRNV
jgi:beta-1,4-N-acetylglucosaminyltransferase